MQGRPPMEPPVHWHHPNQYPQHQYHRHQPQPEDEYQNVQQHQQHHHHQHQHEDEYQNTQHHHHLHHHNYQQQPQPQPQQHEQQQQPQQQHPAPEEEERQRHHFRHNQEVVMTSRCSTFTLTSVALFSGALTLVTLALSVSTDYWLFMREPYRMSHEELARWNLTDLDVKLFDTVMLHLRSGLWNVCTINLKEGNRTIPDMCLHIDFTQDGTGRSMGAPICMTIVGAIRVAAPLPVAALVLTLCGIVMSGMGSLKRNGKTVIAAVCYILSGLCLAVGVVLFISAIYDELGYHSQTGGTSKDFSYYYGWSFYVAGSAFVSSELSAVMCVTLYLRHNARVQDMVRIIPGLEDKLEEDLHQAQADNAAASPHDDVMW